MPGNAFTGGVRPGGLTTSTEIRILLCYLVKNAPSPLSREELESALLSEELVNYFELAANLGDLCDQGLLEQDEAGRYHVLPEGCEVADTLQNDVPRSVREAASRAVIRAQQFARKSAQHLVETEKAGDGYMLHCRIEDMGSTVFSMSIFMPDRESAHLAKQQFIENGAEIYKLVLAAFTGHDQQILQLSSEVQI